MDGGPGRLHGRRERRELPLAVGLAVRLPDALGGPDERAAHDHVRQYRDRDVGEAISDRQVVAVLRPFVRACGPMLDALRESDPFGLQARAETDLAAAQKPATTIARSCPTSTSLG